VQAPLESAAEAAVTLRVAMTDIGRTLAVPLAVKVTAGPDWGHMHAC
jgi:DNA polymerase I-like protein with 3'-5' exonuclease and polymerase domains